MGLVTSPMRGGAVANWNVKRGFFCWHWRVETRDGVTTGNALSESAARVKAWALVDAEHARYAEAHGLQGERAE
jgi:hypothetical protein